MGPIGISFSLAEVNALLDSSSLVILAGSTNCPFFTTEATASLRDLEIGARVLIKEGRVDGVIERDLDGNNAPEKFDVL